jgi:hypothetical protein
VTGVQTCALPISELKLDALPQGLVLRSAVLDRRPLNIEVLNDEGWDALWGDPAKQITQFTGGLYHKATGSRLLYGVLDEWGLPARIRNPWIRSAPFTDKHDSVSADLKTAASSTKNDEVYLILSTPFFALADEVKLSAYVSAQTETEKFTPALCGGLDFFLPGKTSLVLDGFYTQAVLPPTKSSSWFSSSPPLPERDFRLSAFALFFTSPDFSVKSDWAFSETFSVGEDFYGNLGVSFTPPLTAAGRARPLAFSAAADVAGERFIARDGVNHGAGFRTAGKVEWKGQRSSLLRLDTELRSPAFGEDFNRSSSGFYFRLPARNAKSEPVLLTRISIYADRNAVNAKKVSDKLSGNLGMSIFTPQMAKIGPLGVNLSGSVRGITEFEENPSPFPHFSPQQVFNTAGFACEFTLSPYNFQLKSKFGCTFYEKKDEIWDLSLSAAARFKYGRLSIKAASADFPDKWDFTLSWRLEKP